MNRALTFRDAPRTMTSGWQGLRAPLLAPPDGNGSEGGASSGAAATTSTPDPADVAKQLQAAQAKLQELEKKEADRVKAEADQKKKSDDDKLASEGKFKELIASKEKELESLKPLAEIGQGFLEAEQKRIDEKKKDLSEDQKKLVDAQPNILLKGQLVDALLAAKGGATGAKPPPPGGQPPPGTTVDVKKLLADGMSAEEVERKYPKEFAAYAAGFMPTKKLTSFAATFQKKSA